MTARQCAWLLVLIMLCGTGMACRDTSASKNPPMGVLQIRGAGATFPAPLYKKWLEEYHKRHSGVLLSYDSVGSGEGTRQFLANAVDFGASDAAMSDEEMAKVSWGVQLLPVVAGSIVLAYNMDGLGGALKLTRDVYVDIFLGKIKQWNDPRLTATNPGLRLPRDTIKSSQTSTSCWSRDAMQ